LSLPPPPPPFLCLHLLAIASSANTEPIKIADIATIASIAIVDLVFMSILTC
jgi:hypothetical protein